LTLGKQQYFYFGRRFSKHKMARYATNLGWPCLPLATPMKDTWWSVDKHYKQAGKEREFTLSNIGF